MRESIIKKRVRFSKKIGKCFDGKENGKYDRDIYVPFELCDKHNSYYSLLIFCNKTQQLFSYKNI